MFIIHNQDQYELCLRLGETAVHSKDCMCTHCLIPNDYAFPVLNTEVIESSCKEELQNQFDFFTGVFSVEDILNSLSKAFTKQSVMHSRRGFEESKYSEMMEALKYDILAQKIRKLV